MPKQTLIARVSDGLILCASTEWQEMGTYEKQAKEIVKKLAFSSPKMMQIDSGPSYFLFVTTALTSPLPFLIPPLTSPLSSSRLSTPIHYRSLHQPNILLTLFVVVVVCFSYLVVGDIVYITLCDKSYPRKLAYTFLEELAKEFDIQYGNEARTAKRSYQCIKFGECQHNTHTSTHEHTHEHTQEHIHGPTHTNTILIIFCVLCCVMFVCCCCCSLSEQTTS